MEHKLIFELKNGFQAVVTTSHINIKFVHEIAKEVAHEQNMKLLSITTIFSNG